MNRAILILICCCVTGWLHAQEIQSLAGTWRFKLDNSDKGITENWQKEKLPDIITLPGTTDEARYGEETSGSDFGILTRAYKYYGPAWYQRDIIIPQNWTGKNIFLKLERVLWESMVFLDGKEVSVQDALNSPHWHNLGYIQPGIHSLTIRINNDLIYNIGDKGHVYTEYTQSIWNGIIGEILLDARDAVRFDNPQVYTNINPISLQVKDSIINESGKRTIAQIGIQLKERETGLIAFTETLEYPLVPGSNVFDYTAKLPEIIHLWDDVNPHLYILSLSVQQKGKTVDSREIEIGFREITTSRSKILVNKRPVFLRGNLDCVHFPLTGYPSCKTEDWERIFRIYKDYGLNHVRFHSWCPPEAAFVAANRVGIYIQAETIWIDWWMSEEQKERKEMDTKGHPQGLGKNPSADRYVQLELARMIKFYGNHPSFVMQCIGNELGNSDFDIMESWVKPLREKDPRRLYAVSTARKITQTDQFMATHHIHELGATRGLKGGASTAWDFEDVYSRADIPIIAHEIGQWPVYPDWNEIKKYKGVLKARNLEEFREQARKNKIENQNKEFVAASGALNQIMYKYEIESFLRTPSCAGIQLLSMQDYQGQGEALVGWLDVFYDSKGITTPEKFRCHHDTTVTLLRIPKYVWENKELFTAEIQLAHYGTTELNDGMYWKINDELGNLIASGQIPARIYPVGSSEIAGQITCSLSSVSIAKKLVVEVGLQNEAISNSWNIWVYPAMIEPINMEGIYMTDRLDNECLRRLNKGEKVLLDASELGAEETCDKINFYPLYWSLTFFPGQGRNTIGMIVRDKHPLFAHFPTDSHSDWQWQSVYKGARAFYINNYPEDYKPIAQPIDDFHRNNKLAAIFELKIGKGSLLVCGFDLKDENNPVVCQLKRSIVHYMNSDAFAPSYEIDLATLQKTFIHIEPLKSIIPGEFNNALLYMDNNGIETKRKTHYTILCDGISSANEKIWQGEEISLEIQCPKGIIGSLYICFSDPDNKGRDGNIVLEGRNYSLGKQKDKETWIKMNVMREDSNDGKLVMKANAKQGGNLIISKVVLTEE